MANNIKQYDIHERIFKFIVSVIKFVNTLNKTPTNLIFINQIIRSVSSMGANDQEADGALTRKDFVHGFTLVRKEGKETIFWLRLIKEMNKPVSEIAEELIREGGEIVSIVSTIIKKTSTSEKVKRI